MKVLVLISILLFVTSANANIPTYDCGLAKGLEAGLPVQSGLVRKSSKYEVMMEMSKMNSSLAGFYSLTSKLNFEEAEVNLKFHVFREKFIGLTMALNSAYALTYTEVLITGGVNTLRVNGRLAVQQDEALERVIKDFKKFVADVCHEKIETN